MKKATTKMATSLYGGALTNSDGTAVTVTLFGGVIISQTQRERELLSRTIEMRCCSNWCGEGMIYHEIDDDEMPHAVEVYSTDIERIMDSYEEYAINKWLKANLQDSEWEYNYHTMTFFFKHKTDALHFIMVFQ
jgi:hypothetical protein